uniref:rRNA N-glycosidase n=1 Tax=Oryza punctata TaxID=4537 RepID=A0A0E0LM47_ORYPU
MVKPAVLLLLLFFPLLVTPTRIGLSRNPFVPPPNPVPTIDRTEMDVTTTSYRDLIKKWRDLVLRNTRPEITVPEDHPVLAPQYDDSVPPARLLLPKLVANGEETTLALRDSNIYFIGFANKAGQWFSFKNRNDLPSSFRARPLSFGADYQSIAGSRKNLPNYPLGKRQTEWAVKILSQYDPNRSDEATVKRAVVTIILTFCEGLRFFPIRNAVEIGWDSVAYITSDDAARLICWGQISYMLEYSFMSGHSWDSEEQHSRRTNLARDCKILNEPQALETVDVLVRTCHSCCIYFVPFLTANLRERRPGDLATGAWERGHAVDAAQPRDRVALCLIILSETPQESLITVHRGGGSTTVFSDSDLAPPSSIPVQPIEPSPCGRRRRSTPPPPALPDLTGARPSLADLLTFRSTWSKNLRLSVITHSSKISM